MSATPDIEVFFADICPLCHKAMDYLKSRNLPFRAREVFWSEKDDAFVDSENSRDMYKRCGGKVDFVPQIFVNGHHISGWKKMEPMIQSGEFDRLLALQHV